MPTRTIAEKLFKHVTTFPIITLSVSITNDKLKCINCDIRYLTMTDAMDANVAIDENLVKNHQRRL
jgi:hypothetical protein